MNKKLKVMSSVLCVALIVSNLGVTSVYAKYNSANVLVNNRQAVTYSEQLSSSNNDDIFIFKNGKFIYNENLNSEGFSDENIQMFKDITLELNDLMQKNYFTVNPKTLDINFNKNILQNAYTQNNMFRTSLRGISDCSYYKNSPDWELAWSFSNYEVNLIAAAFGKVEGSGVSKLSSALKKLVTDNLLKPMPAKILVGVATALCLIGLTNFLEANKGNGVDVYHYNNPYDTTEGNAIYMFACRCR